MGRSGSVAGDDAPYEVVGVKDPCRIHCAFDYELLLCELHQANNASDTRSIENEMRISV